MNKKRPKIVLAVLDADKSKSPETHEFIDSTLKEECERERMTADEVIVFASKLEKKRKISLDKYFTFKFGTIVIIFFYRCGKV